MQVVRPNWCRVDSSPSAPAESRMPPMRGSSRVPAPAPGCTGPCAAQTTGPARSASRAPASAPDCTKAHAQRRRRPLCCGPAARKHARVTLKSQRRGYGAPAIWTRRARGPSSVWAHGAQCPRNTWSPSPGASLPTASKRPHARASLARNRQPRPPPVGPGIAGRRIGHAPRASRPGGNTPRRGSRGATANEQTSGMRAPMHAALRATTPRAHRCYMLGALAGPVCWPRDWGRGDAQPDHRRARRRSTSRATCVTTPTDMGLCSVGLPLAVGPRARVHGRNIGPRL